MWNQVHVIKLMRFRCCSVPVVTPGCPTVPPPPCWAPPPNPRCKTIMPPLAMLRSVWFEYISLSHTTEGIGRPSVVSNWSELQTIVARIGCDYVISLLAQHRRAVRRHPQPPTTPPPPHTPPPRGSPAWGGQESRLHSPYWYELRLRATDTSRKCWRGGGRLAGLRPCFVLKTPTVL